jgi:receptor protein-tyrosine kinase
MEIRIYALVVRRYLWFILAAMLAAATVAAVIDEIRAPTYQTEAQVVVQAAPGLTETRQAGDLLGNVGSRTVAHTYAQLVSAAVVRDEARTRTGLTAETAGTYHVTAAPLADSLVIQVTATGPDSATVTSYCNAIAEAMVAHSATLYPVVALGLLQPASPPQAPVSPRPARDIPLAGALGLAAGVLLAMAAAYLAADEGLPLRRARGVRPSEVVVGVEAKPEVPLPDPRVAAEEG